MTKIGERIMIKNAIFLSCDAKNALVDLGKKISEMLNFAYLFLT